MDLNLQNQPREIFSEWIHEKGSWFQEGNRNLLKHGKTLRKSSTNWLEPKKNGGLEDDVPFQFGDFDVPY